MAMLQIGSVAFEVTGPHYDKLKSSFKREWARQKRFGRRDALQNTGIGEEVVSVSGTIYPDYFDGFAALTKLKALSASPQMVTSGAGDVFGYWCIVEIANEQTVHDNYGRPGKVTFDVKFEAYGEDGGGFSVGGLVGSLIGRLW